MNCTYNLCIHGVLVCVYIFYTFIITYSAYCMKDTFKKKRTLDCEKKGKKKVHIAKEKKIRHL